MEKEKTINKEIWKDVSIYEGYYKVSSLGRIKSVSRLVRTGRGNKTRLHKGKILKLYKDKDGYLRITLWKNRKNECRGVHTLVMGAFYRYPKSGEQCNHKNGDKLCNTLENLEWCTSKENIHHSVNALGNSSKGEKNGSSKLKENQIRKIRLLLKQGLSQRKVSKMFGVGKSIIGYIALNKVWKHMK